MLIFFIGLISGGFISLLFLIFFLPRLMLTENVSLFNYEESLNRFESAVTSGGWKIPARHNLKETLLKFGKSDVLNVSVFDICNPDYAEKILLTDDERIVASLMPCRVAIYEKSNGKVYFSRMNSGLISKTMGKVTRKQMRKAYNETEEFLLFLSSSK